MNSATPATAASASSSAPRAAAGCGAVSSTAAIAGVMNSTRVCAAREASLRDLLSAPLCSDTATNSSPVSAPARPPVVTAKSRHACGAYAMDQNLTPRDLRPLYPERARGDSGLPHQHLVRGQRRRRDWRVRAAQQQRRVACARSRSRSSALISSCRPMKPD